MNVRLHDGLETRPDKHLVQQGGDLGLTLGAGGGGQGATANSHI